MKRNLLTGDCALLLAGTRHGAGLEGSVEKSRHDRRRQGHHGELTQYALAGTWNYTAPGVKFEGNDLLSQLGGTVLQDNIKQQLDKGYQMAGIKPGAGTRHIRKQRRQFSPRLMGKHELSGTYEFDASTHVATLHLRQGQDSTWVSVPGTPTSSGSVIWCWSSPSRELIDMVKAMGSKISSMETIVAAAVENYKNVYIGFANSKPPSGRKCEVDEKN